MEEKYHCSSVTALGLRPDHTLKSAASFSKERTREKEIHAS